MTHGFEAMAQEIQVIESQRGAALEVRLDAIETQLHTFMLVNQGRDVRTAGRLAVRGGWRVEGWSACCKRGGVRALGVRRGMAGGGRVRVGNARAVRSAMTLSAGHR